MCLGVAQTPEEIDGCVQSFELCENPDPAPLNCMEQFALCTDEAQSEQDVQACEVALSECSDL